MSFVMSLFGHIVSPELRTWGIELLNTAMMIEVYENVLKVCAVTSHQIFVFQVLFDMLCVTIFHLNPTTCGHDN